MTPFTGIFVNKAYFIILALKAFFKTKSSNKEIVWKIIKRIGFKLQIPDQTYTMTNVQMKADIKSLCYALKQVSLLAQNTGELEAGQEDLQIHFRIYIKRKD